MKKTASTFLLSFVLLCLLSLFAFADDGLSIKQTGATETGVKVAWEAAEPTEPAGTQEPVEPADGFKVCLFENGKDTASQTYEGNAFKTEFTALAADKLYTVTVTPYKLVEEEKVYAESSASVQVKTAPSVVTSLKQSKGTATSVTLTWKKKAGAAGYVVYKYNSSTKKYASLKTLTANTLTVSKLEPGKTYKFKVKAYVENGGVKYYGTACDAVSAYTAPAKVTGLKNSAATTTSVKLSWTKVTGATGYKVFKYNSSKKKWALYKTVTTNSVTVSSLKAKTDYKFYVQAYRKPLSTAYYGANSATLTTGTSTAAPTISKVAAASSSKAKVTFKAVSGATGYEAQFSTNKKFSSVKKGTGTKSPVTVSSLTNGKTYYVRLRTYRTVNKVKVYSPYSKVKSFKLAVVSADITKSSLKMYEGCTNVLKVNTYPSGVSVKWSTSDKRIASIKSSGKTCKVTGRKAGTVTITASFTYNKKTYKDTCKVTVTAASKAKKYAGTPGVPDFGAFYGVKPVDLEEAAEIFEDAGVKAYVYMKSDVDKALADKSEIKNYSALLDKLGFEDSMWIMSMIGEEELNMEGAEIIAFNMSDEAMVIVALNKEIGAYVVSSMDLSKLLAS